MSDPSTSLDRLHDLVPPPGISWWPLAPGWYLVGTIFLIIIFVLALRGWNKWNANAYRRAALRELESADGIEPIAEILRRTALMVLPRSLVAGRTGESWLSLLASMDTVTIPDTVRRQLTTGIYEKQGGEADCSELRRYAGGWIRRHRTEVHISL